LYREVNGRIEKLNFPHMEYGKKTASTAQLNKTEISNFLLEYFRSLPETAYSKELQQMVFGYLEKTDTYTALFAAMLNHFFSEYGLLLIGAAHPDFREYEADYLVRLVEQAPERAEQVYAAEQELTELGYKA